MTKIMNKKALIIVVAAVLVCACMAGTTLAWLVDTTDTVTNTFTVGNIDIDLKETPAEYKMIPGSTIAKDPKVIVEPGSEACWLFVKIEKSANFDAFMTYTIATDWTALTGQTGVYYREVNATDAATGVEYSVLAGDKVTVLTTVTKAQLETAASNQPTLSFTAYAVQKENVVDATTAWGYTSNP